MRKERPEYFREWVEHHLAVGFGHMYVGVDDSEEAARHYAEAMQRYIDAGVLTIYACQGCGQTKIHVHNVQTFGNQSFWMLRVDSDEFLVPSPPLRSVVPVLLPLTGQHRQVPMHLKLARIDFGADDWMDRPPAVLPLTEAYTRSSFMSNNVKSIFQTDAMLLPKDVAKPDYGPHGGFTFPASGTCRDHFWVIGVFFVCWPSDQGPYWGAAVFWPPGLPAEMVVEDHVPMASSVWAATGRAELGGRPPPGAEELLEPFPEISGD